MSRLNEVKRLTIRQANTGYGIHFAWKWPTHREEERFLRTTPEGHSHCRDNQNSSDPSDKATRSYAALIRWLFGSAESEH